MYLFDLSPAVLEDISEQTSPASMRGPGQGPGAAALALGLHPAGPSWAHPLVPQVRGAVSRPLRLAPARSTLPDGTSRPVPRAATLSLFIKGQQPH